jgi:hypothetical protein
MVTGQVGQMASTIAAPAMTRPETTTCRLRRPLRSDSQPPATADSSTPTV